MKISGKIFIIIAIFVFMFVAVGTAQPVGATGEEPYDGLIVKKTADGSLTRTWTWNIEKSVDQAELTLPQGQTHTANYTVNVYATESETTWEVQGTIDVGNPGQEAVIIEAVQDVLDNGASTTATCAFGGRSPTEFPITVPAGWVLGCTYSVSGTGSAPTTNQATVTTADGIVYHSDDVAVTYINETVTDECVTIDDNMTGYVGEVCASDTEQSFAFDYPKQIGGYDECGEYMIDNFASFVTNDTGATGAAGASVMVIVPCESDGCSLTYGYWQTHSKYGPAPYDSTWDAKDGGDAEFLGTGVSYYEILKTTPRGGNAFYILAHQYIAVEMNSLNGASIPGEVQDAWNQAQELLVKYKAGLSIPKNSADRDAAIALADILDAYNNGYLGPGHCD